MKLKDKTVNFILIILLALLSIGIYANSLHGGFLIDDQAAILNDNSIHSLKEYFSKYFSIKQGVLWELSYVFIWQIAGANTFYFHLFSVLLNTGCVILLYLLCNVLFKNRQFAFLAALIFAVHPIHTEAVSWISAGHYVFSAMFFLLSLLFYVKPCLTAFNFILAIFFCILGLFSGNAAIVLPVIFISYDLFFREKSANDAIPLKIRLWVLSSITLVCAIFLWAIFLSRNNFMHKIFYFRGPSYLIVTLKALVYYLKIIYLPLARGLYHPFAYNTTDINKVSPALFLSLGVIFISIFAFFKCLKRHKPISFGIAWFFITYLPYSNIVPVCNIVSERYVYLPSAGICMILAYLFLKAWDAININQQGRKVLRIIAMLAVVLFIISYATLTIKRNREYKDIITFWETNINNFPDGLMAYNNLAGTYYTMGETEQALAYSWINLMINKDQPHVWCNLGKVYFEKGDLKISRYCYEEALKIDKGFLAATLGLSAVKKAEKK
ncbi:MAG: tetratricopeptide repeat protein [Candidatus Omnitrophica bacterium]|jgi:tetratricopeptide (TPR) repeat protein|nr:tetratricopeptide repeat protein [Candidatus Omnitrophota bacterium]